MDQNGTIMIQVPNPCCIPLHTCVKICLTISVVFSLGVIIIQSSMIHSANKLHDSTLLPLYKIFRAEYHTWRAEVETEWEEMKQKSSATETLEKKIKFDLKFNNQEGMNAALFKEKMIRENLDLPHFPDYAEMERVSYICGFNGLVGGLLQFVSSLALLWEADKVRYEGHKTMAKIWIAVNGGVLFSLITCILALLLQECPRNLTYMNPPSELLFLILGGDLLLNLYFLWIILAWFGNSGYEHGGQKRYFV